MTIMKKAAVSAGAFALLLGVSSNSQVSALTPKTEKNSAIRNEVPNSKKNVKEQISKETDQTSIEVKDTKLYVGGRWAAVDNFVRATDKDGKKVGIKDVIITGSANAKKVGIYNVTYSILNNRNEKVSKVAKVRVFPEFTHISVKNSMIYVGDKWQALDNFTGANDRDAQAADFKDITVTGSVNTKKPGIYKVVYTMLNGSSQKVSSEATIIVKEDQSSIEVKDSTIWVGDKWQAVDNFARATDKDGKKVGIKDVIITGSVNTKKPGIYKVTYEIIDHDTGIVLKSTTATIMVKA